MSRTLRFCSASVWPQKPALTLLAHSNLAIDVAPWLSARTGAPLLSDCLSLEATGEGFRAVRTLYGGKLHGRFTAAPGECGVLATLRSGAFAAAQRPAEATITP
jgi:electron transfer flavoprotein alpha subunit